MERVFEFDGTKLSYSIEETGKQLVIFLHGFNATRSSFAALSKFDRNYDMVTLDMPGNGKSIANKELSIEYYNDVIKEFINEFNTKVILVGHSLGGATAAALANNPKVKDIVLVSPFNPVQSGFVNEDELIKILKPSNEMEALESAKTLIYNKDKEIYWKNIETTSRAFLSFVTKNTDAFSNILNNQILSKQYQETTLSKYYSNVKPGTKLINGINDSIVTLETVEKLSDQYKLDLIKVQNCGHAPAFEQPETVNNILMEMV